MPQNYIHDLVLLTVKFLILEQNGGHWKLNKIVCFGHLQNIVDLKKDDCVKSSFQKWIISHPHVIKYNIENDYITVKFDEGDEGVKNELRQKVLLQVSFHELHIYMLKKLLLGFPWHTTKMTCLYDWFWYLITSSTKITKDYPAP